jgi:hypothetical protein
MFSMSRRGLFQGAAAAVVIAKIEGLASMAMASTQPFIPYSADSFFKSRVTGAPVDAARTTAFRNFMATFPDQKAFGAPTIKGLGTSKWGTVYVEGNASDPVWHLAGTMSSKVSSVLGVGKQGFHAPAALGSMLTGTSDSPFCVMDRVNGYTVFGGKASRKDATTINVLSAGITYHASNGLNGTSPKTTDKRNYTSRGRISDAMVIRRDLVDYGIANGTGLGHVLHLFITESKSADGFCHPMTGCEGGQNGFGAEGERIFIRPDVDLTKRGLSPFGLVIARTLQEHGCYIGDNAGKESDLKAEQTTSVKNPWSGLTVSQNALLGKVTWADFNVAQRGWQ